ncbi:hypothetical protein HNR42_000398 [Deinobacterium chartae]|uniref:Uncharacterized protein n=1 Tax=Deinobacterium chartae TaxID=521158 RepID=A0A841HVN8_9DEIO|nr:hypothetical protein [Deinobacterium chartae]MBB6096986.1 hypothetical protein [Deinobacterium chartae]
MRPRPCRPTGRILTATPRTEGPFQDQFAPVGGRPEFRYLGTGSYPFDLSGLSEEQRRSGNAVLSFQDSGGRWYVETIDLAQLR